MTSHRSDFHSVARGSMVDDASTGGADAGADAPTRGAGAATSRSAATDATAPRSGVATAATRRSGDAATDATGPRSGGAATAAGLELDAAAARGLIEDLVYEHLIDLVDWERARALAYVVRSYFVASVDDDASDDVERRAERLANELVALAWKRIAEDERVFMESELAWKNNEDDCVLCRELAARRA